MAYRKAHGTGADALARVETAPVDELPEGVPAPARPAEPSDRGPDGRFRPGNALAATGGAAKRGQAHLAARLGLGSLPADAAFAPYRRSAATFRRVQCTTLARTVGGGVCGPGPSSIVASAALALAWSRYLSDLAAQTGDADAVTRAMRLADASRQMLLTAHELCAREATARAASNPVDAQAALRARILGARPLGES
jgi:hypothetical protein